MSFNNLDPKIYFNVFASNPDGKAVLEELCRYFYDTPSYVKGDTHETAFNEGKKAILQFVYVLKDKHLRIIDL